MNNGKRRRASKAAAHVPGNKPPTNVGANRAARRSSSVPRPKPLRPLTDRERQYIRAAWRKAKARS